MKLKVIGSGSAGNCYVLANDTDALVIECGIRFDKVKEYLKFDLSKVAGVLCTHEHGDHAKYIQHFLKAGLSVFASKGTHEACETKDHHRAFVLKAGVQQDISPFKVKAFNIEHDVREPLGFLIHHPDCGNVLFLTDTQFCHYTFKDLNNIIVEANYCDQIINDRLSRGANPKLLRDRVLDSHMSLKTCKELLQANDLSKVNNIVLIHLSDGNSDEARFEKEVAQVTGKMVKAARNGMEIEFNKTAF